MLEIKKLNKEKLSIIQLPIRVVILILNEFYLLEIPVDSELDITDFYGRFKHDCTKSIFVIFSCLLFDVYVPNVGWIENVFDKLKFTPTKTLNTLAFDVCHNKGYILPSSFLRKLFSIKEIYGILIDEPNINVFRNPPFKKSIKYLGTKLGSDITSIEFLNVYENLISFRCFPTENHIVGNIKLKSLRYLEIENQWTSLTFSDLTSLETLSISEKLLSTVQMKAIGELPNLLVLELFMCRFENLNDIKKLNFKKMKNFQIIFDAFDNEIEEWFLTYENDIVLMGMKNVNQANDARKRFVPNTQE